MYIILFSLKKWKNKKKETQLPLEFRAEIGSKEVALPLTALE